MVYFKLKDGGTVSLDDVDEIEVTFPYKTTNFEKLSDQMYRVYILAMQMSGPFPISVAYGNARTNEAELKFKRNLGVSMSGHAAIFDEGDGYEQDAQG